MRCWAYFWEKSCTSAHADNLIYLVGQSASPSRYILALAFPYIAHVGIEYMMSLVIRMVVVGSRQS
jgi:hypothetical protein